jgi:hypothetical protein
MSVYHLWVRLKPAAALSLDLFQFIQRGEDAIGQRLVRKRPQPLGRLHLWRIGWQEQQVDTLWELELSTAVPPCPIQNQHDLFVWSCSHLVGKSGQGAGEHLNIHAGQQQPTGLPTLRMDKGKDLHPFIALGHWGFHRCSLCGPDPSQDGLETDTVLVHRPELNLRLGVLLLHKGYLLRNFF